MGCVRVSCRQIDVPSERERLTLWWGCWVLNKGSSEGVVSLSSSCPSATGLEGSSCGSPGSRSAESVDTEHSVWASQCAIFPESGGANAMEDTSSLFSSSQNQRQWTGACSGRGGAPAKAGVLASVSWPSTLGLLTPGKVMWRREKLGASSSFFFSFSSQRTYKNAKRNRARAIWGSFSIEQLPAS